MPEVIYRYSRMVRKGCSLCCIHNACLASSMKMSACLLHTFRIPQGRIQDLKKEGAQWLRGLAPKTFLANLEDFLKNLGQKGVGLRPLGPPSGSVPVSCILGNFLCILSASHLHPLHLRVQNCILSASLMQPLHSQC